jgi:homoserine dehydrogenase
LKDGQPAITHCKTAFKNKKHVITSNKGPAALAYKELSKLAERNGVKFMIEGTVMSGTPVLNLVNGPLAGNKITAAKGILNGTTNYILTKMEEEKSFEEALNEAQKLGYAEADPTGDVEGHDARAKVTILANVLMNLDLNINDVSCEGITKITSDDVAKARAQNSRWKLVGSVEMKDGKVSASVKPEMIPLSHPLAGVMGSTNALTFTTDMMGDVTIVGKGAGRIETGFSILTDCWL